MPNIIFCFMVNRVLWLLPVWRIAYIDQGHHLEQAPAQVDDPQDPAMPPEKIAESFHIHCLGVTD